eukprot:663322-Amphidinium_carterae.2
MVDTATALYGQYCAMSSNDKAAVETTDQLGMAAHDSLNLRVYQTVLPSYARTHMTYRLPLVYCMHLDLHSRM